MLRLPLGKVSDKVKMIDLAKERDRTVYAVRSAGVWCEISEEVYCFYERQNKRAAELREEHHKNKPSFKNIFNES